MSSTLRPSACTTKRLPTTALTSPDFREAFHFSQPGWVPTVVGNGQLRFDADLERLVYLDTLKRGVAELHAGARCHISAPDFLRLVPHDIEHVGKRRQLRIVAKSLADFSLCDSSTGTSASLPSGR